MFDDRDTVAFPGGDGVAGFDIVRWARRLEDVAVEQGGAYRAAEPFPHAVLDDLFPTATLEEVVTEFPAPGEISWERFDSPQERKLAARDDRELGPATRRLLHELNSSVFIEFLERLTGIEGLIPDPHYFGGGLHQIEPGGHLEVHADFNWHGRLKLDRRINLLLYLNRDWPEEFGGHLELWDRDLTACVRRVLPVFNRCVIFNTTDTAYHGHPEPLRAPAGTTRKSLALYYYSNGRPAEEVSPVHNTAFRPREGEVWRRPEPAPPAVRPSRLKRLAVRVLPPVFVDAARRLRARRGRRS